MAFLLAVVVLLLAILFYVLHQLGAIEAVLIGLLAVGVLLGGYGDASAWLMRRPRVP